MSDHVSPPQAPEPGAAPPRSRRTPGILGKAHGALDNALRRGQPRQLHLSAPTMRWGLLAVATGALLAALATLTISGFDNSNGLEAHNHGSLQPTGAVAGEAFGTAKQGDCLSWTKSNASDLVKVDCSSKHVFEVTADVDLSKYPGVEFGPGSRFPDSLRFTELRDEHCVSAAQKYMGGRLDPRGRFAVGLINPGEAGWKNGERTLRCGLQIAGSTGTASYPTTGSIRDGDQSKVFDPGTCIGIDHNLPTDPIDCAQPHAFEIVSTVDLGAQFNGGPPARTDQDRFLEDRCAEDASDYLGAPDALRNKTLTLFWDYLDVRSWLVGSHKLNCMIGKGADREGFATITGSAKRDILVDGQAPVPPPNSGRRTPAPLPGAAPLPPRSVPR